MKRKKSTILLITAAVLVLLCIFAFDTRMKTVIYQIDAPQIEDTVRLALVTDLHSCSYGEGQSELLEAIDAQSPDIVLLGGDIFDDKMAYDNAEIFIKKIAERYRCFYVTGNHEYWSCDIDYMLDYISGCGVIVLSGDCVSVDIGGQSINICGIDDPDAEVYSVPDQSISEQLEGAESVADNGNYTILLAHRPELISTYCEYEFDLVLSGHAHGGQWRIPGLLNGVFAPNQGLFPKYAGGRYDFDETIMLVSRGLARESTSVPRIFNRPELVIVELI